jgi:hypothetical protein
MEGDQPDEFLRAVIDNASCYLDSAEYFRLLQDSGEEMNEAQKNKFSGNKRGRVARKIVHVDRLYPRLYTLSSKLYDIMENNRTLFPRLPEGKNKTSPIHTLVKLIANTRKSYARSDIHSLPHNDVDMNLVNSEEHARRQELFILSQKDVLIACHKQYGKVNEAAARQVEVDDKVRVAGIVMTIPEMRELLPDMLNRSKSLSRPELDASNGRKRHGFKLLHQKFIDSEVEIALPDEWDDLATGEKVDEKLYVGAFERYSQMDPNNLQRMGWCWTEQEVTAIFIKVKTEYQKMMDKYTQGTGGGSGDDAQFTTWMERDDTCVVKYLEGQYSLLYLSVVKMWDRMFGHVFADVKDPLPDEAAIGERYDDDDYIDYGNEDDDNDEMTSSRSRSASKRRANAKSPSVDKNMEKMLNIVGDMSKARKAASDHMSEILSLLKDGKDGDDAVHSGSINDIEQTQRVIRNFQDDLAKQKEKKRKLDSNTESGKSKIEKLKKSMKETKKNIKIANEKLAQQMKQLQKAMGGEGSAEESTDSSDSDNGV